MNIYYVSPQLQSSPGDCYSLRIAFGPSQDSNWTVEQMLDTEIFLHPEGQFHYSKEDDMVNNYKLDTLKLKEDQETIFKLKKTHFTSLSKPSKDMLCESKDDYSWSKCLDALFSKQNGCQDPWNYHQDIPLPVRSNITQILEGYRKSSCRSNCWNKPLMSQRDLAAQTRGGDHCPLPCKREVFSPEVVYKPKHL